MSECVVKYSREYPNIKTDPILARLLRDLSYPYDLSTYGHIDWQDKTGLIHAYILCKNHMITVEVRHRPSPSSFYGKLILSLIINHSDKTCSVYARLARMVPANLSDFIKIIVSEIPQLESPVTMKGDKLDDTGKWLGLRCLQ